MRKLAPVLLVTSISVLFGAPAFATTNATNSGSPDKATASPSVEANTTNPQGLSYSDKSNTSPGTNTRIDDKTMADHDKTMTPEEMRKHKARMAKNSTMKEPAMMNGTPTDTTNGAAANSTTGTSGK